jgi:hypothetical protein
MEKLDLYGHSPFLCLPFWILQNSGFNLVIKCIDDSKFEGVTYLRMKRKKLQIMIQCDDHFKAFNCRIDARWEWKEVWCRFLAIYPAGAWTSDWISICQRYHGPGRFVFVMHAHLHSAPRRSCFSRAYPGANARGDRWRLLPLSTHVPMLSSHVTVFVPVPRTGTWDIIFITWEPFPERRYFWNMGTGTWAMFPFIGC